MYLLPSDVKVCLLINAEKGEWEAGLAKQIFLTHDAETILSIPLSNRLPPNKLFGLPTRMEDSLLEALTN